MAQRSAGRPRRKNFGVVSGPKVSRSAMDRSFKHSTACDEGVLIPIFLDEILPGDTVSIKPSLFVRMATPLHPILDNIYVDVQFFFAQMRNLWKNWVHFAGEEEAPDDLKTYTIPVGEIPQGTKHSVPDYFGIPPRPYSHDVNALPFRAYDLIWDEWYRDANLQERRFVDLNGDKRDGDGPDSLATMVTLNPRGKRKDYFTSALPWPQAGDPVSLPLGDTSVTPGGTGIPTFTVPDQGDEDYLRTGEEGANNVVTWAPKSGGDQQPLEWVDPALEVVATSTTINAMREAFQVQKLLERDARGGRRYSELLLSHFGVVHPDHGWRPEFLGSMSFPVGFQQVAQTSETLSAGGNTPQGNLAAFAVGASTGRTVTRSFTEHGYILGLMSIRADLTYQQGIHRMWHRETRFDFYWPAFAHLGEQEVLNREIFMDPISDGEVNREVFGYQERYGEYRYMQNMLSGDLRSESLTSLDTWHVAEEFDSLPMLNDDFIQESPAIERVIALPEEKRFLVDAFFNYRHVRPMPMYGVPGMIDHF